MAYSIIEVERKTGVPSRKLRFWIAKGLFPFIQRDDNGVRYFSENDLEWVAWIECYRSIGMSIESLKHYISLCAKGNASAKERLEIIKNERKKAKDEMKRLKAVLEKLDFKVKYYEKMVQESKDELNPLSKDYKKIRK
ncbi:MerR family transcriptional regulator [Campylobacter sp. VTCC 70190]|uniref:MerR family transcriptional regulator n=1 Tax=Campylobacter sp. VTCC 70190 TaxID=3392118 RepID=UPI00398EC1D0